MKLMRNLILQITATIHFVHRAGFKPDYTESILLCLKSLHKMNLNKRTVAEYTEISTIIIQTQHFYSDWK